MKQKTYLFLLSNIFIIFINSADFQKILKDMTFKIEPLDAIRKTLMNCKNLDDFLFFFELNMYLLTNTALEQLMEDKDKYGYDLLNLINKIHYQEAVNRLYLSIIKNEVDLETKKRLKR